MKKKIHAVYGVRVYRDKEDRRLSMAKSFGVSPWSPLYSRVPMYVSKTIMVPSYIHARATRQLARQKQNKLNRNIAYCMDKTNKIMAWTISNTYEETNGLPAITNSEWYLLRNF